jgi:DUF4097 and DUF4098 domain-containing protein YvlB
MKVTGVNGRIAVEEAVGPIELRTVNGGIVADLRATPASGMVLRTINGGIRLWLPANTAADLWMKTMNGGLFTDFDSRNLPAAAPVAESRNSRRVFRSDRRTAVRIGEGGPRIDLETFNGDVRVQKSTGK